MNPIMTRENVANQTLGNPTKGFFASFTNAFNRHEYKYCLITTNGGV